MIYNDAIELVRVHPVKDQRWMTLYSGFSADASDLGVQPNGSGLENVTDPWGNKIERRFIYQLTNEDNEIVLWLFNTIIDGQAWECRIFND